MILEDVRLRYDDNSEKNAELSYHNRILEIHTDKGKITTPTRLTTNSEVLARSEIPLASSIPMDCCISFRPLEQKFMDNFLSDISSKSSMLIKKNIQFEDLAKKAKLRLSIFQPAEIALANMTKESKVKFADIQAKYLQFLIGTEIITYPYLNFSASDYIEFIDKHYRRDEDVSTVFTFDMKMEESTFKKVIDHLIAKKEPMLIAIIYRDWKDHVGQYDHIASKSNEEQIAFIACQVEREDAYTNLSKLHEMTHNSFDLIALKQNSRGGKPKLDLNKIRIFSPQKKALDSIINTMGDEKRDILNELEIPDYNFNDQNLVKKMIKGYKGALVSERKFKRWYYLARVHEMVTSKKEFSRTQEAIRIGETARYIEESNLKFSQIIRRISLAQ